MTTAISLVVGPLLMSIGDLMHPEERMSPAEQIAIVVDHASRWYTAHLLLYLGIMLFIPGVLGVTALTSAVRPAVGYAARILMLIGMAGFASVLTGEMLASRLVSDGVGNAAPIALWTNLFMGPVVVVVGPALLAFFIGVVMFAVPLMRASSTLRWPIAVVVVGIFLILAEILTSRVILSQIGNVTAFCGSTAIAWLLSRAGTDREVLI